MLVSFKRDRVVLGLCLCFKILGLS